MWMPPADIDTRPQEPAFPRVSLLFHWWTIELNLTEPTVNGRR